MSVNGRPFRPDPTSYQMTGIPCGNPKRYLSRAVIRMTKDEKVPYEDQQIGIPGTGTETEAEKEFKKLLDQQMNISIAAAEKKVNFITSTREVTGTASGFMSLNEFQKVTEADKKTNEFRSLGFTNLQIGVMLQQEGITDFPTRKRKLPDVPKGPLVGPMPVSHNFEDEEASDVPDCFMPHPDYVSQSISELRILQNRRDEELVAAANAGPQMSRHRLQLEAALLQGKTHLPLAHIYVNGARKFAQQLTDISSTGALINDILLPKSIALSAYESEDSPPRSAHSPVPRSPPSPPATTNGKVPESNKRVKKNEAQNGIGKEEQTVKEESGEEKMVITERVESIPDAEIGQGRKTEEEIAKQFPNYAPGAPSKVLYAKNLANGVSAQDLVALFIRFQEEGKDKINFKLMDGKMKGSAFITFHDEETATKAKNLVHGFVFKSKPVIIQYGKK